MLSLGNKELVDLSLPYPEANFNIPLYIVILSSLIVGVILGRLLSAFSFGKNKNSNTTLAKENIELQKKLELYETQEKINRNINLSEPGRSDF